MEFEIGKLYQYLSNDGTITAIGRVVKVDEIKVYFDDGQSYPLKGQWQLLIQ